MLCPLTQRTLFLEPLAYMPLIASLEITLDVENIHSIFDTS
jgi:hypothetical protein